MYQRLLIVVAALAATVTGVPTSQAQYAKHTITIQNVDRLTAKYELVEFMTRRSYSGGIPNFDLLKFRKPVRNPYMSHLFGGGIGHNLTDQVTFRIEAFGDPSQFIVYFDFDRSNIRESERAVIARAIAYARRTKATSVRVIGHADRSGSDQYNVGLSNRRARSVADALRRAGIQVEARGESDPAVPTADGVRHQANRRAAIIIVESATGAKTTGRGVRIIAERRFFAYPATRREKEVRPPGLWPYDPTLKRLMRKFARKLGRQRASR